MKPASKKIFRKSIPHFANIISHLKIQQKNSMNCCFHLHCTTPRQSIFETAPISFLQEEQSPKQEDLQIPC